jgi:hypothetical protein
MYTHQSRRTQNKHSPWLCFPRSLHQTSPCIFNRRCSRYLSAENCPCRVWCNHFSLGKQHQPQTLSSTHHQRSQRIRSHAHHTCRYPLPVAMDPGSLYINKIRGAQIPMCRQFQSRLLATPRTGGRDGEKDSACYFRGGY